MKKNTEETAPSGISRKDAIKKMGSLLIFISSEITHF